MKINQYVTSALQNRTGLPRLVYDCIDDFNIYGVNESGSVDSDIDPNSGLLSSSIDGALSRFCKDNSISPGRVFFHDIWASKSDEHSKYADVQICNNDDVYLIPKSNPKDIGHYGIFNCIENFTFIVVITREDLSFYKNLCIITVSDVDHYLISAYDRSGFAVLSRRIK